MKNINRTSIIFLFLCAGFLYAIWLLIFTLSDGFATLGSDSANYILLARKWSPYFTPSDAVTNTWPMQTFPVAFPLLLAITGASNSFLFSHLAVSIFLLLSLVLVFFLLQQKFGIAVSFLTTFSIGLLPGMFTNSMGILSENMYLFLSICLIVVISYSLAKDSCRLITLISISILLLVFMNTRTIGISIIPAIITMIIFDRSITAQNKRDFTKAIIVVTLLWLASKFVYSIEGSASYFDLIKPSVMKSLFNDGNDQVGLKQIMFINFTHLPYAWNQFFSLSSGRFYFPIFSLVMLCAAQICVVIRAVKLKLDALYVCFYFLILIFWPFPIDDRFLHPVVILMLLQPLLLVGESKTPMTRKAGLAIYSISMVLMLTNSFFVHYVLFDRKVWANDESPEIGNYLELYEHPDTGVAIQNAKLIDRNIQQMRSVKKLVPENKTVSANKPVFFALLTNRKTIPLKTNISIGQQICNMELKDVDYVYFSHLTTDYTRGGLSTEKEYKNFIEERYVISEREKHVATLVRIDKSALLGALNDTGYNCDSYTLF